MLYKDTHDYNSIINTFNIDQTLRTYYTTSESPAIVIIWSVFYYRTLGDTIFTKVALSKLCQRFLSFTENIEKEYCKIVVERWLQEFTEESEA